jgi:hypothetical protein
MNPYTNVHELIVQLMLAISWYKTKYKNI